MAYKQKGKLTEVPDFILKSINVLTSLASFLEPLMLTALIILTALYLIAMCYTVYIGGSLILATRLYLKLSKEAMVNVIITYILSKIVNGS